MLLFQCCTALGLLNFLAGGDLGDILSLMKSLELIFSSSYLKVRKIMFDNLLANYLVTYQQFFFPKGDGSVNTISVDAGAMHAAALSSWGLLLTLIPAGDVVNFMDDGLRTLPYILIEKN